MSKRSGTAVVLGSGMAGLVSARVLADHFDSVAVIEKDEAPAAAGFREGVPQGRHFHALIPGGLEIMESLMPGLKAELRAAGSVLPEPTQFYFYLPEGKSYDQAQYMPEPPPPGLFEPPYIQTRGLLEFTVRQRVADLDNLDIRYGTAIKRPLIENGRVTGVIVDGTDEQIRAELVVDATGKASRTLGWLDALGFERPHENVVNCDFAYTSCFLKPDNPDDFTDVGFFVTPNPEKTGNFRGAALVLMEDGSWLALVGGRYGDFPPRDYEGFLEYAGSVAEPRFGELVKRATLIGEPAHFRFPKGIRRRFDQLEAFPEGLLPMGDAVCHFNPAYGQGMSSACRQGIALQRVLEQRSVEGQSLDGMWKDVFQQYYEETRAPWLFAALADFMHPDCSGDFPEEEQPVLAAMGQIRELAMQGNEAAGRLLQSVGTLKMPLTAITSSEFVQP